MIIRTWGFSSAWSWGAPDKALLPHLQKSGVRGMQIHSCFKETYSCRANRQSQIQRETRVSRAERNWTFAHRKQVPVFLLGIR